jgi:hypothetical protein
VDEARDVTVDRLVIVQFGCRDELLGAVDAHGVAEVCFGELALEATLLLFFDPPAGFQRQANVFERIPVRSDHQCESTG